MFYKVFSSKKGERQKRKVSFEAIDFTNYFPNNVQSGRVVLL
jgi:hypothetical protein